MKRGRKPGTPKTGGRQPGSQNQLTRELKTWLQNVIDNNRQQFETDLQAVEPEKRLQVFERLLAYILPKPQSLDIAIEYRELERLLERTPDTYIEKISAKILELNTKNSNDNEREIE
jgi:regulator of sirC expression with transglutaminase-like and TPR domain